MNQKINSANAPIIMLVLLILASIAFIALNVTGISADNAELAKEQNILFETTRRRDYLLALAANKEAVERKSTEFLALLPETVGQNDILLSIHRLSGKYNVAVSQVSFDSAAADASVQAVRLGFSLAMVGRFEDIMKMLEELTGRDRIIQIESLALISDEGSDNLITANVTIAVYHR